MTTQTSARKNKLYHITRIQYPYEKTWDKSKTYAHIDMEYLDSAFVNSLRRTIINNVETIGIRTEPQDKNQITIFQNDTPLHNQFLSHRIGMIPINIPNTDKFNCEDYELIIDVENDTSYPKNIYSSDIKIRQISSNKILSNTETKKFFPPDPITGEYILITMLKPKYYNNDIKIQNVNLTNINPDKLKLYLKSGMCKGIGGENGRFCPTTCCVYQNMIDPEKAELGLTQYIINQRKYINENGLVELTDEQLTLRFNTSLRDRYFYTDDEDEPNKFTFKIESIGVIPPLVIMYRGLKRLREKLDIFITNLTKNNEDIIIVIPSTNLPNCYEYIVQNEDDTLGNIIQNNILKLFCKYGDKASLLTYIGYIKTHPLKKEIKISIQTKNKIDHNDITKNIIIPACNDIIKTINKVSSELEKSTQLTAELKSI